VTVGRSLGEDSSLPSVEVRQLDPGECESLFQSLEDTPETVIASHQLRHGLCNVYVEGGTGRPDAVVLRPFHPRDELVGFGSDIESLGRILRSLPNWSCVNVDDGTAHLLGPILEAGLRRPVRYTVDVYHTLDRPVMLGPHESVRYLRDEDLDLLTVAPTDIQEACLGCGTFERLLEAGIVAGAVINEELVAVGSTWATSVRYADLAVVTFEPWRGRGLATACAALVAAAIQRSDRVPVWSTGEHNVASLHAARKLGFKEVGRRTYVSVVTGEITRG
jgi:GNAT superfamily N-acetyltransferase